MSERPSVQFTADRAPTVETLRDEKDPIVRSYLENLRGQVATIAAKYGVNARDVFRVDVQERMEVDDFVAIAALVKRIGMFSKDRIPAKESAELRHELDRRETRAEEMLAEAVGGEAGNVARTIVVEELLRAGELDDIWTHIGNIPPSLRAKACVAMARRESTEKKRNEILNVAFATAEDETLPLPTRMRIFSDAFAARLTFLSDGEVETLARESTDPFSTVIAQHDFRPISRVMLGAELAGRGRSRETSYMRMLENLSAAVSFSDPETGKAFVALSVEFQHAKGLETRTALRDVLAMIRPTDPELAFKTLNVVVLAAKVGDFELVEELARSDVWTMTVPKRNAYRFAAIACVERGNLEKALELLRRTIRNGEFVNSDVSEKIVNAYLERGELNQATDTYVEFMTGFSRSVARDVLSENYRYLAARARRGEDVLAQAAEIAVNLRASQQVESTRVLASAAIATIVYTRAMKRRLGL